MSDSTIDTAVLGEKILRVIKTLEVEEKVKSINEVKGAEVEITFDPPWSQDLMSEEAKLELGML
jgi:metal-sulfur cluster biosynthetic enzyme